MKILIVAFFALTAAPAARADGPDFNPWHEVLSCDNGAAVVDNLNGVGRGGAGVGAQVVIRNPQIVSYFQQNSAAGQFVDGQWIGKSFFEPFQTEPAHELLSFQADGVFVKFDGTGLTVTTGGANWHFQSCLHQ